MKSIKDWFNEIMFNFKRDCVNISYFSGELNEYEAIKELHQINKEEELLK